MYIIYSKLYTDLIRQRERICCPVSLTWLHQVQNLNVEIYICNLSTSARSVLQENILNIQQKPESTYTHTQTHTHTQAMKTKAPKTSWLRSSVVWGLSSWLCGKESACSAGDSGSIPGPGRSPGEGNGHPLQYFCLGKSHGQRSLVGYSPRGHRVGHDRGSTPLKDSHQGSGWQWQRTERSQSIALSLMVPLCRTSCQQWVLDNNRNLLLRQGPSFNCLGMETPKSPLWSRIYHFSPQIGVSDDSRHGLDCPS